MKNVEEKKSVSGDLWFIHHVPDAKCPVPAELWGSFGTGVGAVV